MTNDTDSPAIARGLAGVMEGANPGWTHIAEDATVRSTRRRFWPVQRRAGRTVYDTELRLDIVHAAPWNTEQTELVATSLNAQPSHVACWDWTGSDVWIGPEDRVPPELCRASGGHFFGESDECGGCGFRALVEVGA